MQGAQQPGKESLHFAWMPSSSFFVCTNMLKEFELICKLKDVSLFAGSSW